MEETKRKQLGFIDCMGIGIGQIIGSGIMVLTGVVVGVTGHGTPLTFILAALLVICTMTATVVLTSAVPSNGGGYSYVKKLIGPHASFMYLGMFVLSQVLIATFALGFAQYFAALVPGANVKLVAMLILIAATIVNLVGVKTAASVQNIMVACLLLSLLLFAAFGLPKVDWSNMAFTAQNLMPNGTKNFLTGIALLSFATGGAKFLAETAGEVKNPGKTVPRAMILSTIIVAVFYALVGIVAAGVLPLPGFDVTCREVMKLSMIVKPIPLRSGPPVVYIGARAFSTSSMPQPLSRMTISRTLSGRMRQRMVTVPRQSR